MSTRPLESAAEILENTIGLPILKIAHDKKGPRAMKSVMVTILGLLLVILGVYSIFYLIASSASPHLLSVVLVTGLLGAFVSLISSLVFAHFFAQYLGGHNHTPPATGSDPHTTVDRGHRVSGVPPVMWPIVLSVFFILSAVVTHALNTPRPISRELHLTYLLNPRETSKRSAKQTLSIAT